MRDSGRVVSESMLAEWAQENLPDFAGAMDVTWERLRIVPDREEVMVTCECQVRPYLDENGDLVSIPPRVLATRLRRFRAYGLIDGELVEFHSDYDGGEGDVEVLGPQVVYLGRCPGCGKVYYSWPEGNRLVHR